MGGEEGEEGRCYWARVVLCTSNLGHEIKVAGQICALY